MVILLGSAAMLVLALTAFRFASGRIPQHGVAAENTREAARRKEYEDVCERVVRKERTEEDSKAVSWPWSLVPLALAFIDSKPSEEIKGPIPIRLRLELELAAQAEFEAKELELIKGLATQKKKPFFRFYFTEHQAGFSSCINNGLNALLIARRLGIPFQFVVKPNWGFVSWEAFFDDWTADVSDPEYRMFDNGGERSCAASHGGGEFSSMDSIRDAQGSWAAPGREEEVCLGLFLNDWAGFRKISGQLEEAQNGGKEALFQVKRRYAQAIWHLKPDLQCFVDAVVKHVFNPKVQRPPLLVGVHIRHGDKIGNEGKNLPPSDYAARVLSIEAVGRYQTTLVFTFSDDDAAVSDFERDLLAMAAKRGLANGTVQVVTMSELLPRFLLNYTAQGHSGYDHGAFGKMSNEDKLSYARDFILTLSLNRFVDYFVGTFSSNVGRMAALLRYESGYDTNLSLDDDWHHV